MAVIACLWAGWLIDGRGQKGNILRSTLVVAVAALVGAGLAAFALEPSIALYLDNNLSGHQRGALAYEAGWSQLLWHLLASPLTAYPIRIEFAEAMPVTREVYFRYRAVPPFWVLSVSLLSRVVVALIGAGGRKGVRLVGGE